MSITTTGMPGATTPADTPRAPINRKKPTTPPKNKKDVEKQIDNVKKQLKDLTEYDRLLKQKELLEKNANQFICALRLDMVSDKLEPLNPKLAKEIDSIADAIELGEWEGI